jgi:hypothetical protein
MGSSSLYALLLCLLIFNNKGLGFNIERALDQDASDSLDDEQQEVIGKRQFVTSTYNSSIDYTKDNSNVYFGGQKVVGASAASF